MDALPFASYLQVQRRRNLRLYLAFVAAALLWGAFLAFVVVLGILEVPELSPPPIVVQWLRLGAPPPEPPAPKPRTSDRRPPETKKGGASVSTPLVQPPPAAAPGADPDDGEVAGVAGAPAAGGCETAGGCPDEGPPPPAPPPPPPPPPTCVPAIRIMTERLSGEAPHLPAVIKAQHRGETLQGSYQLCMDREGAIVQVRAVVGIPGADGEISAALRAWRFRPQPVPVCFVYVLQFIIE